MARSGRVTILNLVFRVTFLFGALCLVGWIIWKESKRYSKARTLYCVYKEVWTSTACIITCSNSLNMIIIAREPDQTRPDWKSKQVCQISVKVSLRACDTVLPCTANKPRLKLEDGVTWVSCERQLIDDFLTELTRKEVRARLFAKE